MVTAFITIGAWPDISATSVGFFASSRWKMLVIYYVLCYIHTQQSKLENASSTSPRTRRETRYKLLLLLVLLSRLSLLPQKVVGCKEDHDTLIREFQHKGASLGILINQGGG